MKASRQRGHPERLTMPPPSRAASDTPLTRSLSPRRRAGPARSPGEGEKTESRYREGDAPRGSGDPEGWERGGAARPAGLRDRAGGPERRARPRRGAAPLPRAPPASNGAAAGPGAARPRGAGPRAPACSPWPPGPRTPAGPARCTRLPTVWLASCFMRLNCFFMVATAAAARGARAGQDWGRPDGSYIASRPRRGGSGGGGSSDRPGPWPRPRRVTSSGAARQHRPGRVGGGAAGPWAAAQPGLRLRSPDPLGCPISPPPSPVPLPRVARLLRAPAVH